MDNISQIYSKTIAIAVDLEQISPMPLTSNERTWYGFFMEYFESLAHYFCPNNLPETTPFRDVVLVANGYYSLTNERFNQWRDDFTLLNIVVKRIPGCFILSSDQCTAIRVLELLTQGSSGSISDTSDDEEVNSVASDEDFSALLRFINEGEGFDQVTLEQENCPSVLSNKVRDYIPRFSSIKSENIVDLIECFSEMQTVLEDPDIYAEKLILLIRTNYNFYITLLSDHISTVLKETIESSVLLEESLFYNKITGDLILSEEEKNYLQALLRDYQINQTIVRNALEITTQELKEKIAQLLEEMNAHKKARNTELADQKKQEALDLFESRKKYTPPIAEKKAIRAQKAFLLISAFICNFIEKEILETPHLSKIKKRIIYDFMGDIKAKREDDSATSFSMDKESFMLELRSEVNKIVLYSWG